MTFLPNHLLPTTLFALIALTACTTPSVEAPVWEMQEITLESATGFANPYTDAEVWIDLKGPDFSRRVHGFWDGCNTFRVRFVATVPGEWSWVSGSEPADAGLSGETGKLTATTWTEEQLLANPNRRGFLRATSNGHALQYADGTPFFYTADTWWACTTYRYPWKGAEPDPNYQPGPGMGFEEAVQFRKKQGYNGFAMIAAYPSWHDDGKPPKVLDDDGVILRQSWNIGKHSPRMTDEDGNRPFSFPGRVAGYEDIVPDFDRINPAYFQSLDRKMQHFSDHGFVPFFESFRRDQGAAWKHYYDWPDSYVRYLQYLVARYGAYNMIFSGIHADWFPPGNPTGDDWNNALTARLETYGAMPFGQPTSTNIATSTYRIYGHEDDVPWLTMHGVGNEPRDHRTFALMEELFHLPNPYPAMNNEPFYPHSRNHWAADIKGEQDENNRAAAWGSVLNGALAGHVYGTQGYYVTTGDPPQNKPYIWEALNGERFGEIMAQARHLKDFMLSEGARYRDLIPDRQSLDPNQKHGAPAEWSLAGWSSLMRTEDHALLIAYFEVDCPRARIRNLPPGAGYSAQWFNPRTGAWSGATTASLEVSPDGALQLPAFPGGASVSEDDWALKLIKLDR